MRNKTNEFVVMVSTINGSGSQSANLIMMRAIANMGVPVSGKNSVKGGPSISSIPSFSESVRGSSGRSNFGRSNTVRGSNGSFRPSTPPNRWLGILFTFLHAKIITSEFFCEFEYPSPRR